MIFLSLVTPKAQIGVTLARAYPGAETPDRLDARECRAIARLNHRVHARRPSERARAPCRRRPSRPVRCRAARFVGTMAIRVRLTAEEDGEALQEKYGEKWLGRSATGHPKPPKVPSENGTSAEAVAPESAAADDVSRHDEDDSGRPEESGKESQTEPATRDDLEDLLREAESWEVAPETDAAEAARRFWKPRWRGRRRRRSRGCRGDGRGGGAGEKGGCRGEAEAEAQAKQEAMESRLRLTKPPPRRWPRRRRRRSFPRNRDRRA